jgi:hypothetical protein
MSDYATRTAEAAVKLLARFYEAHDRQEWQKGESLADVRYEVSQFLERLEDAGWQEAKVERRPAEPPPPKPVTARPRRRK